jgi:hypothetical protein
LAFVGLRAGSLAVPWVASLAPIGIALLVPLVVFAEWKRTRNQDPKRILRWTSLVAVALFPLSLLAPSSRVIAWAFSGVALAIALALIADARSAIRSDRVPVRAVRALAACAVGAGLLGMLMIAGDALPLGAWRVAFFGTVALLGTGLFTYFRERDRSEHRTVWERRGD